MAVVDREERASAKEAELSERGLQDAAFEKELQGVTAAQQEWKAQLGAREAALGRARRRWKSSS
jgi:hypothetical protein